MCSYIEEGNNLFLIIFSSVAMADDTNDKTYSGRRECTKQASYPLKRRV